MHLNDHNAVIFLSRLKDLKAKYILTIKDLYEQEVVQLCGEKSLPVEGRGNDEKGNGENGRQEDENDGPPEP